MPVMLTDHVRSNVLPADPFAAHSCLHCALLRLWMLLQIIIFSVSCSPWYSPKSLPAQSGFAVFSRLSVVDPTRGAGHGEHGESSRGRPWGSWWGWELGSAQPPLGAVWVPAQQIGYCELVEERGWNKEFGWNSVQNLELKEKTCSHDRLVGECSRRCIRWVQRSSRLAENNSVGCSKR